MTPGPALDRLQNLWPLLQRQQALPSVLQRLHRRILRALHQHGRALSPGDVKALVTGADPHQALRVLQAADLVLVDRRNDVVFGAYPLLLQETPHHLLLNNHALYATSAFDALAAAPLFDCHAEIRSRCAVTDTEIFIYQQGRVVLATNAPVAGGRGLFVGIRWRNAGPCAAQGLCRDMVFLKNEATALRWRQVCDDESDVESDAEDDGAEIFALSEAIELAAAFYLPLLHTADAGIVAAPGNS